MNTRKFSFIASVMAVLCLALQSWAVVAHSVRIRMPLVLQAALRDTNAPTLRSAAIPGNPTLDTAAPLTVANNTFVGVNIDTPQYRLDVNGLSTGNPIRLRGLQQGSASDSLISAKDGVLRRIPMDSVKTLADRRIDSLNIALAVVAKTGQYADLQGKPTIPNAQVQTDWNAASGLGAILNKPSVWLQNGNSFFANNAYKVGITNGVSMGSTNPYYFIPLNRFLIGLNTDAYGTSADKCLLQMASDKLSFDGIYGSKKIALVHQAGSFSATDAGYYANIGASVNRGLTISYQNTSVSNIALNAISSTGNDFKMNISMSEKADFLTDPISTGYALSSAFQNGDFFLNKATQKAYIKNNNLIKPLAFDENLRRGSNGILAYAPTLTSADIGYLFYDNQSNSYSVWNGTVWKDAVDLSNCLKIKATNVYASHAAATADSSLPIGMPYRLQAGSADLGTQSEKTRFEK